MNAYWNKEFAVWLRIANEENLVAWILWYQSSWCVDFD